ncbi:MAG: GntR family transcriptional regulator [Rhodobacteraceae bacterium]|nr:GntR family transcriptional regulator [Paracoccaceae bacterium]
MLPLKRLARSESLAHQAYFEIRRAIREGEITRGQFFSEAGFAQSLGVSRTPVREALLDLFREGIVEILPKRGFRLAELDEGAIEEIRMVRICLERLVVSRLCLIATDDDIVELRNIVSGKGTAENDMFGTDETFHMRMAEIAQLPHVRNILMGIRGKMYLIASGARIEKLRNEIVLAEHHALLDRIAERDAEAAETAIAEHITMSIDSFMQGRKPAPESRPDARPAV